MNVLALRNVHFKYRDGTAALDGLSVSLAAGECVGLVGPNGAGKTTLSLVLAGFLEPAEGDVHCFGEKLEAANVAGMRRRMGFLFHDPDDQLFLPTVLEDVAFGPRNAGLTAAEAERKAREMLATLGLAADAGRFPGHLSAGRKRLAALAGVLVTEPELLVCDEPSAMLDPWARRQVIDHLRALTMTRLVVTHDLELVLDLCPRVLLMSAGRIVADGDPRTVLADAELMARHRLEVPASLRPRPNG